MDAIQRAVVAPQVEIVESVLRGGRSFGIARHWHPVLKIYMIPFITSRTSTWRLLPPRLSGGINGSTCAHSSSVRSLGYRNLMRSSRPWCFAGHLGVAPFSTG